MGEKSDVEQATKLTCDDDNDEGEEEGDSVLSDKSRNKDPERKRMRGRRRTYEGKGCEDRDGQEEKEEGTSYENHISFNSTTLYPINRMFVEKRKRREKRGKDVSDMNNLPVIASNQEEEDELRGKPISLPLTQSKVPWILSSPLNPTLLVDSESGLVDPLSSQREAPSNHINEPDEELFIHDMAVNPNLRVGGVGSLNRDINSKLKYSSDGSRSWLYFTPTSKYDFGSFECWATNSIGKQSFPCLFTINAAGNSIIFILACTLYHTPRYLPCLPSEIGSRKILIPTSLPVWYSR